MEHVRYIRLILEIRSLDVEFSRVKTLVNAYFDAFSDKPSDKSLKFQILPAAHSRLEDRKEPDHTLYIAFEVSRFSSHISTKLTIG